MDKYTREELVEALRVVSSTITKCEKMYLKFIEQQINFKGTIFYKAS